MNNYLIYALIVAVVAAAADDKTGTSLFNSNCKIRACSDVSSIWKQCEGNGIENLFLLACTNNPDMRCEGLIRVLGGVPRW